MGLQKTLIGRHWALVRSIAVGAVLGAAAASGALAMQGQEKDSAKDADAAAAPAVQETETGIFAGGCFWCVEEALDKVPGVLATVSGYTGGNLENPTYKQVARGETKHLEAVKVVFDPALVSYDALLDVFWRNIDPTDPGGQFCDQGLQYTTAIFAVTDSQRETAEASKAMLDQSGLLDAPVVTAIRPAGPFYAAESYHQDYYLKNPVRYRVYKVGCGRERRLNEIWGAS